MMLCRQCEASSPATGLGWVTVQYGNVADYTLRFCGVVCLHRWGTAGMDRLTKAVLAPPEPTPEEVEETGRIMRDALHRMLREHQEKRP